MALAREIKSRVCILGAGPAAILCGRILLSRGIEAVAIGRQNLGMLRPKNIDGIEFSPIPVFIRRNSPLLARFSDKWEPQQELLSVEYSAQKLGATAITMQPASLAAFLSRYYKEPTRALVLAEKHLGKSIFSASFPEVQQKVQRHYPDGSHRDGRLGFVQGLSPQVHLLIGHPQCEVLEDEIQHVDLSRRTVKGLQFVIQYERLISTINLGDFLALIGRSNLIAMESGSAEMAVFRTDELIQHNSLIYDCDPLSPIYRLFIPTQGIVIAHIARERWALSSIEIAEAVQRILALRGKPRYVERLALTACYPLAVSDLIAKEQLEESLHSLGALLFGRFGEWTYRDLDELDWEKVDAFVSD
jgi:hypothetical protein